MILCPMTSTRSIQNEYALSKVLVLGETVPVVSVLDLLDEQDSGVVEDAVVVVDLIRLQTSLK